MMNARGIVRMEVLVKDAPVAYLQAGSGLETPVVLLHGLGGSAAVWKRNLVALSGSRLACAPELWGPGRFDKNSPLTLEVGHTFLTGFMDALNMPNAHLVGGSLGGLIAVTTAIREPSRVRSLTLVATAGLGRRIAWSQRLLTLPGVGEYFFRPTKRRVRSLLKLLLSISPSEELVEDLYSASLTDGATAQMLASLRAGVSIRGVKSSALVLDSLPSVTAPTLLCWGTDDPLFPIDQARSAAAGMPNAELLVFDGSRHWPFYERAQAFNAAVSSHIERADDEYRRIDRSG